MSDDMAKTALAYLAQGMILKVVACELGISEWAVVALIGGSRR